MILLSRRIKLESDMEFVKNQERFKTSSEKVQISSQTSNQTIKKKKKFVNDKVATCFFNSKLLLLNNETSLALNLLRYSSNCDSYNGYVLDALNEALRKLGKFDESEKVAQKNFLYNYSIDRCFELAQIYFLKNQDEEALKLYFDCLSHVVENQSQLFEIYKNVGNIYVKLKEFDLAEEYFYKAYQMDMNSDLLIVNIGVLEFQKEDIQKATDCFRRAIEINKNNDKAWVGLAMTHLEFGDKELCWGNLIKALDVNPVNKTALILLSQLFNQSERNQQCKKLLIEYLEHHNFDEEISLLLIQNLIFAGDYQNAFLECFKSYLWNPENEEIASVYVELNKLMVGGK